MVNIPYPKEAMKNLIQQVTAAKEVLELIEKALPVLERIGMRIIMPNDESMEAALYPEIAKKSPVYTFEERQRIQEISNLIKSSPTGEVSAMKISFKLGISVGAARIWTARRVGKPDSPFKFGSSRSCFRLK